MTLYAHIDGTNTVTLIGEGEPVLEADPQHVAIDDADPMPELGWVYDEGSDTFSKPQTLTNAEQMRDELHAALDANQAFLKIKNPTALQTEKQCQALTKQMDQVLRLQGDVLDDVT